MFVINVKFPSLHCLEGRYVMLCYPFVEMTFDFKAIKDQLMGKGEVKGEETETSEITLYDDEDPEVVEDLNEDPTYEPPTCEPPKKKKLSKPGKQF